MPSEKSIVNAILKRLKSLDQCYAIKLHGSMYSTRGTPDVLCVKDGQAYLLEVKQPGKKPTAIQEQEISKWNGAKAIARVVTSVQEALEAVLGK